MWLVLMNLGGRRATIMGLGRHGGGVAAARYCALGGAAVTVTDLADERALTQSLAELQNLLIARLTLGHHDPEDFRAAEIVVVNPAVRPENEFVEIARKCGATITSEIELFLDACPAQVVGVTGTVGKSTTAAMLATILQAAGRRVWLGGNIGNSLLGDLQSMHLGHIVVLELSSFQLHWLTEDTHWPVGAIVTNCSPNHLDWHRDFVHYAAAKQRLVAHLPADGSIVLNTFDGEVTQWKQLCCCAAGEPWELNEIPSLRVPGKHNRVNAACAAGMAQAMGIKDEIVVEALAEFSGLPHRLAMVADIRGRRFYNDSKSTTPQATFAALCAVEDPMWLLLGGAMRPIDLSEVVKRAIRKAKGVALFGEAAPLLAAAFRRADPRFPCCWPGSFDGALKWCFGNSRPGEAIVLSPGFPSTDQYRDFAHRGEEFARIVHELR
jgi:UDP-N-acetylmuramoylalanine--D-glutamate ligase